MSYFPSISQSVTVDTANSSTANIVAGATWNSAGTGTSTLGVAGIQLVVKMDKTGTVYVDQGTTDSVFQVTDSYQYLPGVPFGLTIQAVSGFVRVRVTNNASTDTTAVVIETVLCPIVEALPRSLDKYGHLLTTAHGLKDEFDFTIKSGPMGTLDVDQPYRLVGTSFGTTIDTTFWTATNGGTGSSTSASTPGIVTMTSGTDNNGYSNLTTIRSGRFIFAHPHKFRAIVRMTDATVATSTRRWGAYTASGGPPVVPVDGFWFELSGAGVLSVNCRNNSGTITTVASGSFNGDVSQYVVDENAHAYEIIFFLGSATYFIDNVKVHTFVPTTTMLSSTFTLPVSFQSSSQAINSSAVMEVWAGMILRLGRDTTSPRSVFIAGASTAQVLKSGAGRLRKVITSTSNNGSTVVVYDALTATNTIMSLIHNSASDGTQALDVDIDFYTGLTVTTTGAGSLTTLVFE